MDTIEGLQRKITSASELRSVVKAMKAMAASKIGQYEMATAALSDYYLTVESGLTAYFRQGKMQTVNQSLKDNRVKSICALIFGSDQGLVGQFNDSLSLYVANSLNKFKVKKEVWAVGERMKDRLSDLGFIQTKFFSVPNSVSAITSLVEHILVNIGTEIENGEVREFYIFNNRHKADAGYEPVTLRLLPLDNKWQQDIAKRQWPTNKLPQVVGAMSFTLAALIREHLFVSIYKASAESLASENASRLEAMERAEKNINELLEELKNSSHRVRQSSIDEDLFDVVSGFEAFRKDQ